jgi:hypothetical protein
MAIQMADPTDGPMDRIVPVFAMVASVTYSREILALRHEGCSKASKIARAQGLQPSNDRAIFECRRLRE